MNEPGSQEDRRPSTTPPTTRLRRDPDLVADLQAAEVDYSFTGASSPIGGILISLLPFILIGAIWYFVYRRMAGAAGGAGGGIFGVGRSKAKKVTAEQVGVTFKDVGGADEAIAELQEIIQFLKTPEQFARLGGRIPKGVLLVGPPGTGKTLLAKATAGEAGVRLLREQRLRVRGDVRGGRRGPRARPLRAGPRRRRRPSSSSTRSTPSGRCAGAGYTMGGGNDEREQTLNQLLAEIDGFSTDMHRPVIIMAATNRPEVLDKALLRAGRFDRQVEVGNPDLIGRVQILKIHSQGIKLAHDFDLERAARITPGFSGADLANAMNEAALLAARRNAAAVTIKDFEIGHGAGHRRAGEEDPGDERAGAQDGGLPRVGSRAGGRPPPQRRPGGQDQHHPPGPRRAGLHPADAHRGPLHPHRGRAARTASPSCSAGGRPS